MVAGYIYYSATTLNGFIENAQQTHKQSLTNILESYNGSDLKALSKQLKDTFRYDSLDVTDLNNQAIYRYQTNQDSHPLWQLLGRNLATTKTTNENLGIAVNYQLNHDDVYAVYNRISGFILGLALLMLMMGSIITHSLTKRSYRKASRQISKNIASEIKTTINNKETDNALRLPTEFDDVNKELSELKTFIANKMIRTQKLEQTAYVDSLTALENRSGFIGFYEQYIEQHNGSAFGALVISRCAELATINKIHGYQEGDRYVNQVANILKKQTQNLEGAKVFRLNGADFATFLPNITIKAAQTFCSELTSIFNEYQQLSDYDSIAYSGIVKIDASRGLGELLALADSAISIAQTRNKNAWYMQQEQSLLNSHSASFGNQDWSREIDFVIENQSVSMRQQIIQPSGRNNRIYHEILSRFESSEAEQLPTATFIAMAEKLDKIVLVDRLIIEKSLAVIKQRVLTDHMFGINLSIRSIHDQHFIIWLERRLMRDHDIAKRLVFEVSEYGLEQNIAASQYFIEMAHRVGARVCVEHFGKSMTSFKFFRDLSPDYVKIDGSYTRDIHSDRNNQYFLRLIIDLAHRLGIRVLAEAVETQQEKHAFDAIFIDGCQGYYLGKPEAL